LQEQGLRRSVRELALPNQNKVNSLNQYGLHSPIIFAATAGFHNKSVASSNTPSVWSCAALARLRIPPSRQAEANQNAIIKDKG